MCVDLCQVTVIIVIYKWTGARLKYEKNMTLLALQHNELHAICLKIASHTEKCLAMSPLAGCLVDCCCCCG